MPPADPTHINRQGKRALAKMARALGIEPEKYGTDTAGLWRKVQEKMAGGVATTVEPIIGDPFGVFLIGICQNDHGGKGPFEQMGVVKTGHHVDETEMTRILDYLKAQDAVNHCEECGEPITVWQADNTRMSTFAQTWNDRQGPKKITMPTKEPAT